MRLLTCALLTGLILFFCGLSHSAHAQLNAGNFAINQFANGAIDVNEFTRQITSTGNMGQLDAQQFVSNIVGNNGATLQSLGNVVDGVMGGQLGSQTALGLSTIQQLGQINSIEGMSQLFSNPLIKQGLEQGLQDAGLGDFAQQVGQIFSAGGAQGFIQNVIQNSGMMEQAAQMISNALGPELTAALGGIEGILSALTQGLNISLGNLGSEAAMAGIKDAQDKQKQNANYSANCRNTCPNCCNCHDPIVQNHKNIRAHTTNEFEAYRTWLVSTWYTDNMVPALMVMTSQMTAAALNQVQIFGQFLDAKHQMETQRLFQQMTARAHKDYQPSEGMCEFGTAIRSLAASERRADLGQVAFSQRLLKREMMGGDGLSVKGGDSDKRSRLAQFIKEYCDINDNGEGPENTGGLEALCSKSAPVKRQNKDIDYTRTIDTALTLDVDFTEASNSDDEKDIFALTNNLYAHDVPEIIIRTNMADDDGNIRPEAFPWYMDLRSLVAKRSVAQNSMAAIASMKSKGSSEVAPFIKKFIEQLGLGEDEINKLIGDEPSYFAQMEVLTKKIYENPKFYADLYDKPANVERKIAALEAIGLMQDRDIYKSLMRSEAILAVYLESMLLPEQKRVSSEMLGIVGVGSEENKE